MRLTFWVADGNDKRKLEVDGESVMKSKVQSSGAFQIPEAWIMELLEKLQQASPLRVPCTLVLRRRQVEGGMVHVDASLEPQQQNQNQQQWWRRLQRRLQLPL